MTLKTSKKNIIFTLILLAFLFLLSLISYHAAGKDLSEGIRALIMTLFFVIVPGLSGVLLKVIINDRKNAVIITAVCTVLWAAGNALIWGGKFLFELLIALVIFPIIMLFYFITHLTVTGKKKKASAIIASISALIFTLAFWWGNAIFFSFAK